MDGTWVNHRPVYHRSVAQGLVEGSYSDYSFNSASMWVRFFVPRLAESAADRAALPGHYCYQVVRLGLSGMLVVSAPHADMTLILPVRFTTGFLFYDLYLGALGFVLRRP